MNKVRGRIFVITGPSGSGKTTLAQAILKDRAFRRNLRRSVSCTTRPRRPTETEGKDYFFVSEKEFARRRRTKKILEWTRYLGYYYGTEKSFVDTQLKAGRSLIFCIDVKGARRIRSLYPGNSVLIFVLPPSLRELKRRILGRCPDVCPADTRRRLARAKAEIQEATWFDYRVRNKDFTRALTKMKKIIASYGI